MKNVASVLRILASGIFAIATAYPDIFSISDIPSNLHHLTEAYEEHKCLGVQRKQEIVLTEQNGIISSNTITFSSSGCEVALPKNFSTKTHTLLVHIQKMAMRISCPGCDPTYCRRDIFLFGENICKYEPDTCLIFQSELRTSFFLQKQLNRCKKQYWIIQASFNYISPLLAISNPIENSVPVGKQFELQYFFVPHAVEASTASFPISGQELIFPTTSKASKKQLPVLRNEYIITICLGVVILALVVTIIFICMRGKNRPREQGVSYSTPNAQPGNENVYSTPIDAYSMTTGNVQNNCKNGTYDTLAI